MKNGFTLLELIIVLVVIGVLATLGLTHYSGVKERALGKEAIANLKIIQGGERIYRLENPSNYVSCQCMSDGTGATQCDNTTDGCNYLLKLRLSAQNWQYWVAAVAGPPPTPPTFIAYADRQTGPYSACQYTITQDDTGDPTPNASCP